MTELTELSITELTESPRKWLPRRHQSNSTVARPTLLAPARIPDLVLVLKQLARNSEMCVPPCIASNCMRVEERQMLKCLYQTRSGYTRVQHGLNQFPPCSKPLIKKTAICV